MFFELSKTLGFFAAPSNVVITAGILGVALMATRFAHAGRRLVAASILLLAVLGFSPFANALIMPLEQRFPPWTARGAPDGIVVLGGAIGPSLSAARGSAAVDEAAERITVVADLARRYPAARIIYSGGTGALLSRQGAEADFALPLLESFGIARDRLMAENRSRNTVENALFSKALAKPAPGERWILVTSAYHMPRSIGIFRAAGFPVEAYPVDWRTRGTADLLWPFSTLSDGLRRTDTAAREWTGLLIYWLTGRTSELFPGPALN
jgi:uncharacterized SAM-binding protein YcdF (DUF218 family)